MPRKRKCLPSAVDIDDQQWEAERLVRDALMNTPEVKREVKRVAKELKGQKKKVQQHVRERTSAAKKPRRKRDW